MSNVKRIEVRGNSKATKAQSFQLPGRAGSAKTTKPAGLGKKKRRDFDKESEYNDYLVKKKEKKKKKKNKKKEKKSSWWDTILSIGSKILPHILPFFMSKTPDRPMTYSIHNRVGAAEIGSATPASFHTSTEPRIAQVGDHLVIEHTGVLPQVVKKFRLGTSTVANRGDVLFSVDLNPAMESWLSQQCSYAQYDIEQIAFTFHPAIPTIQSGQIMGFFEVDPDAKIAVNQGDATMKQAGSLTTATIVDLWQPHSFVYCFHERHWYWTSQSGSERRLQEQGGFRIIAARLMDDDLPDELGTMTVSYQVRVRHAVLAPRPELGLQASFTKSTGTDGTYPFGTVKDGCALGEIYSAASASMPYIIAPTSLPWSYDTVRPGNVAGSCFRFPRGVYSAIFYTENTTSTSVSNRFSCDGSYKMMYWSYGNRSTSETFAYGVYSLATCIFYSSGMEASSGFACYVLGATTVVGCMLVVTSLGGQYPGPNALSSALSALEKKVDKFDPSAQGCWINSQEGDVMKKRLILTADNEPVVCLRSGDNAVCVGSVVEFQTTQTHEYWKILTNGSCELVNERVGVPYAADGSMPVKKVLSLSAMRERIPSNIIIKLDDEMRDAVDWFVSAAAKDLELVNQFHAQVATTAAVLPWILAKRAASRVEKCTSSSSKTSVSSSCSRPLHTDCTF